MKALPVPKQFGVPEILRGSPLGQHAAGNHRVPGIFLKMDAIPAHGKALLLHAGAVRVCLGYACVHQVQAPVHLQGSAGKAPLRIIGLIRGQGNRFHLPVNQIFAAPMSPVHGPLYRRVGMVLVKQMIPSPIDSKAIGIV